MAACESVGERPDAFHCAVRVVCLALADGRRSFGDLLVLSFVAGLLLGTLAAVPGCVAMLAHRYNMPTILVSNAVLKPFVVRSHHEQQSTGISRTSGLFSFWSDPRQRHALALDPAFSDCVSQSPMRLCGLLSSLTMKTVFGHAIALQRSMPPGAVHSHPEEWPRHFIQPLNTRAPRNLLQCDTSRPTLTLVSTSATNAKEGP
jgi:hypothetical protein